MQYSMQKKDEAYLKTIDGKSKFLLKNLALDIFL